MRKYLFRIENLLLLIPLLSFCFYEIFNGNTAIDIHLHDTYFVINNFLAFVPVFAVMFVLYLFHWILRLTNKWQGKFCKLHVFTTAAVFLLIAVLLYDMSHYGLAGTPRHYYDVSLIDEFSGYSNIQKAAGLSFLVFLLLQVIFFFYFIMRVLKKQFDH